MVFYCICLIFVLIKKSDLIASHTIENQNIYSKFSVKDNYGYQAERNERYLKG